MDFNNRAAHPQAATHSTSTGTGGPAAASRKNGSSNDGKWARIGVVAAVAAVVILLLGVIVFAASTDTVKAEDKYVDSSKLQAVFLNTGQVYFGNVKSLNSKYIVLGNIYYLQTSGSNASASASTTSNSNVSLVKLGCELHEPLDQMVINRDQVTFWENLGTNGQVAKAVVAFEKQNPDGQKCSDQSSAASTNSGASTQNAGTTNNSSTNKSTTP
jgi:hypothetical protein